MKEHFEKDPIVSHQDVRTAEEILNNHARALTRVFNIGKGIGQMRRFISNKTKGVNNKHHKDYSCYVLSMSRCAIN